MTIQAAITKVVEGSLLSRAEAEAAMAVIMAGEASPAQIAGLVTALRVRGETADEVAGFARAMRATGVRIRPSAPLVADTCGTGGDGKGTLNISTGAALVVAGAGIVVAKHGNRAMSSKAGSADVLEALGVRVDATPPVVAAPPVVATPPAIVPAPVAPAAPAAPVAAVVPPAAPAAGPTEVGPTPTE